MEFFAPIQETLAGSIAHGPLFAVDDIDSRFDALVAQFGVVVPEYVEYVVSQPVVAESFEEAWARESAAIIKTYRGSRKATKGGK